MFILHDGFSGLSLMTITGNDSAAAHLFAQAISARCRLFGPCDHLIEVGVEIQAPSEVGPVIQNEMRLMQQHLAHVFRMLLGVIL